MLVSYSINGKAIINIAWQINNEEHLSQKEYAAHFVNIIAVGATIIMCAALFYFREQ